MIGSSYARAGLRGWLGAALLLTPASTLLAHGSGAVAPEDVDEARLIRFPDVAGARTLVVDLHSHSVFSDGHVWPKLRIEEALRDGLDAFAVTEHLEWQPHLADIPHPDRNRSFQEASAAAEGTGLIVIAGSEITRELPAGHINAVFIEDANALLRVGDAPDDPAAAREHYIAAGAWPPEEAVGAANGQGAFVFINHPDWPSQRPNGIAELTELHHSLIGAGQLHGVEIANGDGYSAEAFRIALEHNLTLLGVSDVHDLIDWDYPPAEGAHRPVTLVFTGDASADGIREALFERRTVVWFKNLLLGREAELKPLLEASLTVQPPSWVPDTELIEVVLENRSDASFELRNLNDYTFMGHDERFRVPAHGSTTLIIKPRERVRRLELELEVQSALTAPGAHPVLTLEIAPR